jgi:2-keto-myo-inositol isomerase
MAMKGFGLNSWTTGDRADVLTDLRVSAEAGYQFVEWRDHKIEQYLAAGGNLESLRGLVAKAGLQVLSVNTLDGSTYTEGAAQEELLARCRTLCGWAQALGSPYVIVGPSYLPAGSASPRAIHDHAVDSLSQYSEAAAEYGVRIVFEFHGYAHCSINNLAAAMAILEDVDDARLGLVVDAFHFYVGESRLDDLEGLHPSRLCIVHLADVDDADRKTLGKPNRVFPGEGVLPLGPLIESLKRTGYEGPYSLELFRPDYWAMDPLLVARRGLESMKRFV